jgi:hypothetical protein
MRRRIADDADYRSTNRLRDADNRTGVSVQQLEIGSLGLYTIGRVIFGGPRIADQGELTYGFPHAEYSAIDAICS